MLKCNLKQELISSLNPMCKYIANILYGLHFLMMCTCIQPKCFSQDNAAQSKIKVEGIKYYSLFFSFAGGTY